MDAYVCLCPQQIPCGLEAVTESGGAVLGPRVGLARVWTTGLSGLAGWAMLGMAEVGAAVGARGLLATVMASRIQSRSLVTRA